MVAAYWDLWGPFMTNVFTNWEEKHSQLFGKQIVQLEHNLHERNLFTDEKLARLIEILPRETYHVNTMDKSAHDPSSWREGEIGHLSGEEVLQAIKNGEIWINIRKIENLNGEFKDLLDQIFSEIQGHVPDMKTYKETANILISSPKIQVYYHCDVPGQSLWQLRGRKRVYVYPNTAPFLTQEYMENIVLGEADEQDMPYESWYDDYATIVDLEPGQMVHWPINGPHRVANHDCINVSLTTSHWSDELRNSYANHYANGLLRRAFGLKHLSRATDGPFFFGKLALAGIVKKLGLHKSKELKYQIDFRIDPTAPKGFSAIEPYMMAK